MVSQFVDAILGYLKSRPYWQRIEPIVSVAVVYIATLTIAYEYIQWRFGLAPAPSLFIRSYIVKQITVAFTGALVTAAVIARLASDESAVRMPRVTARQIHVALRAVIAGAVIAAVFVPLFLFFSPHKVSQIRVKFLDNPEHNEFDKYAFAYIVYELNKLQRRWYFTVDFDVFNPDSLTMDEQAACGNRPFCLGEHAARGEAFIGVTTKPLGDDFFWRNEGAVSAISTSDWNPPPSTYRFLTYSLILQSILIHLNTSCSGLPPGSGVEQRVAYGDLFGFSPRRNAMKAQLLAAHLSPSGEELLLNCFGAEYVAVCTRLLQMDWARAPMIVENLEKTFGVKF